MRWFIGVSVAFSALRALIYLVLLGGYKEYPRKPVYDRGSDAISVVTSVAWAAWGCWLLWRI